MQRERFAAALYGFCRCRNHVPDGPRRRRAVGAGRFSSVRHESHRGAWTAYHVAAPSTVLARLMISHPLRQRAS